MFLFESIIQVYVSYVQIFLSLTQNCNRELFQEVVDSYVTEGLKRKVAMF